MWPTEYVELKRIDELLTCGICYEYMDTSVITLCSHNYCSLCIRRYLHYKTQCPICSEETFEKDLRKNKVLDEIIIQYLNVKEKLKRRFHQEEIAENKISKVIYPTSISYDSKIDIDTNEILHKSPDSPILTNNISTPTKRKIYEQDVSSPSTSTSSKIPSIFTPKSKKGFRKQENCNTVTCPVCKVNISQHNINKHLDDCLKRESAMEEPKKTELKRKPLPKLVLKLMKDNEIRKKLKELGLSSQGDRKVLENRLQRYTVLYNAECDKLTLRSVAELIKQCEEEENLEKKASKPVNRLNINRNTEHNVIEKQRKKYLAENKDSFEQLITKIKTADNSQKLPVKRNILNRENTVEVTHKDHIVENDSAIRDNRRKCYFLPIDSTNSYIDDSDSDTCPLQDYSHSENPIDFLTIEFSSSSNNDTDQQSILASSHDISNNSPKTNSISFNSTVKTENTKIELPICESSSKYFEETTSDDWFSDEIDIAQVKECNVSEKRTDIIDIKESFFESTRIKSNNEENAAQLSKKSNRIDTKCSQEKDIPHSVSKDEELYDTTIDRVVEDIECNTDTDNQLNYEESQQELLRNTSDHTKFEKNDVESSNENVCLLRKRERDMTFTLSDDEKMEDGSTNGKKSARLSLSEVKGFNNKNYVENASQMEGKLQNEKKKRMIHKINMASPVKRFTRSRSKINNGVSNNETKANR